MPVCQTHGYRRDTGLRDPRAPGTGTFNLNLKSRKFRVNFKLAPSFTNPQAQAGNSQLEVQVAYSDFQVSNSGCQSFWHWPGQCGGHAAHAGRG